MLRLIVEDILKRVGSTNFNSKKEGFGLGFVVCALRRCINTKMGESGCSVSYGGRDFKVNAGFVGTLNFPSPYHCFPNLSLAYPRCSSEISFMMSFTPD